MEVIKIDHPQSIQRALEIIAANGLIAFPTDTVYGLASSLHHFAAIEKIFAAKERNPNKAIAVLLADLDQLPIVTDSFSDVARKLADQFWPGALTVIVQKKNGLPENLSPFPTIGIRIPAHDYTRRLLRRSGPLATTSANLSGSLDPQTAEDVINQLSNRIDLVLDGGRTAGGIPSTVVDCTSTPLKILREGAISASDLQKVIAA